MTLNAPGILAIFRGSPKGPEIAIKINFCGDNYLILLQAANTAGHKCALMAKKQMFTLEYPVRCSPAILYGFLSTPAGLQEWFADKVDERDNVFFFSWNGSSQKAEVLETQEDKFIRYHWLTAPKEEY